MATAATEQLPASVKEVNNNTYIIRPNYQHKFRSADVKELIHSVLVEYLTEKSYKVEDCSDWCKEISNQIKARAKEQGYERYKFITQVVIGEQKGEGVKMSCRCFWDSDTDSYAQDIFINDPEFSAPPGIGGTKKYRPPVGDFLKHYHEEPPPIPAASTAGSTTGTLAKTAGTTSGSTAVSTAGSAVKTK